MDNTRVELGPIINPINIEGHEKRRNPLMNQNYAPLTILLLLLVVAVIYIIKISQRDFEHNPDKFEKKWSGVQSIVILLSIIFGGFWTLYTFDILQQAEEAQINIRNLKMAKEKVDMEFIMDEHRVTPISKNSKKGVEIDVTIKNTGSKVDKLNVGDSMKIYLVEYRHTLLLSPAEKLDSIAESIPKPGAESQLGTLEIVDISPGDSKIISYYVELPNSGTYFSIFSVPITRQMGEKMDAVETYCNFEQATGTAQAISNSDIMFIQAISKYFYVE